MNRNNFFIKVIVFCLMMNLLNATSIPLVQAQTASAPAPAAKQNSTASPSAALPAAAMPATSAPAPKPVAAAPAPKPAPASPVTPPPSPNKIQDGDMRIVGESEGEQHVFRRLLAESKAFGKYKFEGEASDEKAIKAWHGPVAHLISLHIGDVHRKIGIELRISKPNQVAFDLHEKGNQAFVDIYVRGDDGEFPDLGSPTESLEVTEEFFDFRATYDGTNFVSPAPYMYVETFANTEEV